MKNNEQAEQLGNKIWSNVKTELLLSMRFMAPALSMLEIRRDMSTTSVGTDAVSVLFNPNYVFKTYVEDPSKLNRTYLHMLLHCMFRHMYRASEYPDAEMWDLACDIAVENILDSMDYQCIYRVSSDLRERWYERLEAELKVLTAEKIYSFLEKHCEWTDTFEADVHTHNSARSNNNANSSSKINTNTSINNNANSSSEINTNTSINNNTNSSSKINNDTSINNDTNSSSKINTNTSINNDTNSGRKINNNTSINNNTNSGENINNSTRNNNYIISEDTWNRLVREFKMDDHGFWDRLQDNDEPPAEDKPDIDMQMQMRLRRANKKEIEDAWKNMAKRIKSDMANLGDDKSTETGSLKFYLKADTQDKVYYTEFLNQIAVVREEIGIDPDSFDYGLYNYGMEIYGNMPLIEENEYTESHKIDELVIAIDTSASCSEELVQSFLNETAGILRQSESFFREIHVHIIECDNKVQNDIIINHPEDMEHYAERFEVSGGYGTDFRPVFSYVDDLRKNGQLKHLRGLMYFTDGFGDYPENPTDYDTAFIFPSDKQTGADKMPVWAIQLSI